MQKARRHIVQCFDRLQAYGFRFYFTPLLRVLFTFPSRYQFTIGLSGVFSLTGWSRQIHTGLHVSRTTQGTAMSSSITYTRLSLSLVCLSKHFQFSKILMSQPYNPNIAVTILVWANPRSLATTNGIIVIFSSYGYLDVSVHHVCPLAGTMPSTQWVAPFGNLRIIRYVPLPVAYRSLSRPSSPLKAQASAIRPYLAYCTFCSSINTRTSSLYMILFFIKYIR